MGRLGVWDETPARVDKEHERRIHFPPRSAGTGGLGQDQEDPSGERSPALDAGTTRIVAAVALIGLGLVVAASAAAGAQTGDGGAGGALAGSSGDSDTSLTGVNNVVDSMMARTYDTDRACEEPQEATQYHDSHQNEMWTWSLADLDGGTDIEWTWYDKTGELQDRDTWEVPSDGRWCFWSAASLDGTEFEERRGDVTVEIRADGNLFITENGRIDPVLFDHYMCATEDSVSGDELDVETDGHYNRWDPDTCFYHEYYVEGLTTDHPVTLNYYRPSGDLYDTFDQSFGPHSEPTLWSGHHLGIDGREAEDYPGQWRLEIVFDGGEWSYSENFWIDNVAPQTPAAPSGGQNLASDCNPGGYVGDAVTFGASTNDDDREDDDFRYQFDWGDGARSWTGWTPPGETATDSHTYDEAGSYNIQVRAKDPWDSSGWSDSTAVCIRTKTPSAPENVAAQTGPDIGQIDLSWDVPSWTGKSSIDHYRIERAREDSSFTQIAEVSASQTTFRDSDLDNGIVYHYRISAVNDHGEGPQDGASAETQPVPDAPTDPGATMGDAPGEIDLNWTAANVNDPDSGGQVSEHKIYRGTSSGSETHVDTVGNVTSYTDTGLADDQQYFYRISAVNDAGEGPLSAEVDATTASVPTEPRNVSAEQGSAPGQIDVACQPPESDGGLTIDAYRLYRGTDPGDVQLVAEDIGTDCAYTDTGLANDTTYHYRVSAVNDVGESQLSDVDSGTTASVPTEPLNLTAMMGDRPHQIELDWSPPSDDGGLVVEAYHVYSGPSENDLSHLAEIDPVESFNHGDLPNGAYRCYRVSAENAVGEGPTSPTDCAQAPDVPDRPLNFKAVRGDEPGENELSWDPPSSNGGLAVDGYRVYAGETSGNLDSLVTLGPDARSFSHTGLPDGAERFYRVSATNEAGEGNRTAEASAVTPVPPGQPDDPRTQRGPGRGEITVCWDAPADGGLAIDTYTVYVSKVAGGEDVAVRDVGPSTCFTQTGLDDGAFRYYTVEATNDAGTGPLSEEVRGQAPERPTRVRSLNATPGEQPRSVRLDWQPPAEPNGMPVTEYKIYRTTIEDRKTHLLATVDAQETTYLDEGIPGVRYYYRVTAQNGVGESPETNETSAKASTLVPTQPTPVGEAGDPDADFIPQPVEAVLCSTGATQLLIELGGGNLGSCETVEDYQPPTWFDTDQDRIPDALEPSICQAQDDTSRRDGVCADRDGDGFGDDYGWPRLPDPSQAGGSH